MDITWDTQNHELIASTSSGQAVQRLDWILRDKVAVNLYLVTPASDDDGYDTNALAAGLSLKFGIKYTGAFAAAALASSSSWTEVDVSGTKHYSATLNLNTEALIASHAANKGSKIYVDFTGELTFLRSDGHHQDSTQVTVRVTDDVNRVTDTEPDSIAPRYEYFTDSAGKECLRIMNTKGETLQILPPAGGTGIPA